MRTVFVGGTKRGFLTLRALIEHGANIVGVISLSQDEHEAERYEEPIRSLAVSSRIPLFETKWMKERDYVALLAKEIRPDVNLVVGCRILIPGSIYTIPPRGTLAVHDSLLPEYRGFAPLNWSILNGEDHTGVTLFYLDERMDGGDIVAQKRVPIGPDDTAPQVYEKVCAATVDVVLEAYPLLERGEAPGAQQDYAAGSFCCSRTPSDGLIDWEKPTVAIYNLIRGLTTPYPGAFTFYEGRKLIVWNAKPLADSRRWVGAIPGRIVSIAPTGGHVDVLTGDGTLRILEVQTEDRTRTAPANVIRSVRKSLGLRLEDLHARLAQAERQVGDAMGTPRPGSCA